MIKVVSFDVGNTLLRLPEDGGFCSHFSRITGISFEELRPVFQRFFLTRDLAMGEAVAGACRSIGFLDPDAVINSFSRRPAIAFDDVLPTLERLKASGLVVITLSNCVPWEAGGLDDVGLADWIDEAFYSFGIGAAKPDVRVFAAVQAHFDLPSSAFLHVGDSLAADVEGATNAGWSAALVDRKRQFDQRLPRRAVQVIHHLSDLRLCDAEDHLSQAPTVSLPNSHLCRPWQ